MARDLMRGAAAGLMGLGLGIGSWAAPASGQASGPAGARAVSVATNANGAAGRPGVVTGRLDLDTGSVAVAPNAVVRVLGTAATGVRVTLDGSGSTGGKLWFRWLQTSGARVALKGADQPVAAFVVPADAAELGFVLVVGNGVGVDAHAVGLTATESEQAREEEAPLKADAGGDLAGAIGRRVVLDGSKSEPEGRIRFRWVQIDGPRATIQTAGSTCAFVPEAAGTYRFALMVVGANDLVSDAALATVRVRSAVEATDAGPADRSAMALDEFSRAALLSVPGGPGYAPEMARILDDVADGIDETHRTYKAAANDLIRRLDGVIPRAPRQRDEWIAGFLKPWMAQIAERMKGDGIDLAKPADQDRALSKAQRARLADQFRYTAAGLRSSTLER